MKSSNVGRIEGRFQHLVFSPRGEIEGVLVHVAGAPVQIVFERHDGDAPRAFTELAPDQSLTLEATPMPPSKKGDGDHPVHDFVRLVTIDGQALPRRKVVAEPAYRGTVVRLNYARHGAPNGVVLDTGDFIHTRPDGFAQLKLKVGDAVTADGDAQLLAIGKGWAVEAVTVNGKAL